MKKLLISLIYLYRWLISPFLPSSCKFTPTCSRYAISAIECHGVPKGLWMTLKRLLRCHPFTKIDSSYDPVPSPEISPVIIPFTAISSSQSQSSNIFPANVSRIQKIKRVHN